MAADRASAADAPQMATAPPVSRPKNIWKPINRASTMPTAMVSATASTTMATGCQPSASTWSAVMRRPKSATPRRSTCRATKSMPAALRVACPPSSCVRKFNAMPSSKANSMTGAP
ncbi:hypothetical protein D9M68_794860 [compost metagenome]